MIAAVVTVLIVLSVAVLVAMGAAAGLDAAAVGILVVIVGLGALAIAVIRRSQGGAVAPLQCESCGGVNSPHAPYCKHCGSALSAR